MGNNTVTKLPNKKFNRDNNNKKLNTKIAYISELYAKREISKDYKIYTPEIMKKYNDYLKTLPKLTKDTTKAKFIIYNKVRKWYESKENLNFSIEKIHINSKLGSYTSGGCGIGASFFAGLTASGILSYMDSYIKRLGSFFLVLYSILVLYFGVKILSNEDKKVEMYNTFLQVLYDLENDKNEK